MKMETTNALRIRASRFFTDRYAYRTQPDYLSELIAFGVIVLIAVWPMVLLANAMALGREITAEQ
jgi:ABC-type Fe3+-siderophore transport system permease subunit